MANDDSLKAWVSDQLMSLLGYSQPTIVQYIIGLSKQATSPADVVGKLVEFGCSSTGETHAFAAEIFARAPRRASGLNSYQKQEREAAMLVRKQKTYAMLDADDDDEESSMRTGSESRKTESRQKRFRKKHEVDDDEDDEVIARDEKERQVKRRISPDEDDGSEVERMRVKARNKAK